MKSNEYPILPADAPAHLSIGAVAERFGLATHVLRHWETTGLLTPDRDAAGRRRYSDTDVTRVAVILHAKEAGLPLGAIRALISTSDGQQRTDVLLEEAKTLRSRIAASEELLALLETAIDCHHDDFTDCASCGRALAATDPSVDSPDTVSQTH
ncbi:MerR family transcriptional regulator [Streptomyces sp. NPDC048718]|uniref:helix-turn-helix domain-containing protein n=1 Tax=Streptomyces sp. NPDC048718 TaxID=3365587 RepID=UPI00371DEE75